MSRTHIAIINLLRGLLSDLNYSSDDQQCYIEDRGYCPEHYTDLPCANCKEECEEEDEASESEEEDTEEDKEGLKAVGDKRPRPDESTDADTATVQPETKLARVDASTTQ